jgi:hypothetical protein
VTHAPNMWFSNHDRLLLDASMRNLRSFAVALATLTLLACEAPTSTASQLLAVSADGTALALRNPNAWPVFYLAVDPNFLALADFALCTNPDSDCPRVPAFGTVRVPYTDIAGNHTGQTTVRVMQWRLQRTASGEYEATDLLWTDVALQ